MNDRLKSFDALRYILALLVLFGHTFVMFYRTNNYTISVMIFFCIFAFICYHAQKWLFAKLKQLLFVPAVQNNEGVN